MTTTDAASTNSPGTAVSDGDARILRLIAGVHAGAERECRDGEVLLVGSGYDCDLVLADGEVGDHHCVLSFGRDSITVRAVAAPVRIDETTLAPGEARSVGVFVPIRLGEAALIAGERDDPRWRDIEGGRAQNEIRPPRAPRFNERFRVPLTAAGILVFALSVTIAVSAVHAPEKTSAGAQRRALGGIIETLGLSEASVAVNGDGQLEVDGVIPDAVALDALKQRAERQKLAPAIRARLGEDIAKDVREVLRLSRLNAQTHYLGGGRIAVRGHFPDPDRLAEVLNSPSMAAIPGLTEAVVENLEPPPQPPPAPEPFQIASIVTGSDPHIVGRDGAQYYRGAELPGMGKLLEIDAHVLLVDTGTEIRAIPRPGVELLPAPDQPSEAESAAANGKQDPQQP